MEKAVILSDGEECTVRVLGLFELDDHAIGLNPLGAFMEEINAVGGRVIRRPYIPPDTPPLEPKIPREEVKPGSAEANAWEEYDLYMAYVDHRKTDAAIVNLYLHEVKDHILEHCIAEEDQRRIVIPEDWQQIQMTALSAQLTEEDLAAALAVTFQG